MQVRLAAALLVSALTGSACAARPALTPEHGAGQSTALGLRQPLRQTPADITEHATPAIVTVRAGDALGTGFLVRPNGWVVTNFHVVRDARDVTIVLANHREFPVVEIVNASRLHDLVILRIEARDLPVLALGNSDRVRPGDSVLAIGHPLGFEDTVSNGLISAVRDVQEDLRVLQISAPIAPGSSGGPLFNERGEVIGVATAIITSGQNLNFGLPSNYVKDLMGDPRPIPMAVFSAAMDAIQRQAALEKRAARNIPHHTLKMLKGCTVANRVLIGKSLADAIEVGAPLYDQGKRAACYHVYEGAAADLEQRLPGSCAGPKRALSEGRRRAAQLREPSAQAWVMRDSFDGLLELLERAVP